MSQLGSHPNLVRYHAAWLEDVKTEEVRADIVCHGGSSEGAASSSSRDGIEAMLNGEYARVLYIVMQLCDVSLEEFLSKGQLAANPILAKRVFHGVLTALAHVHSKGFIHRDVKPANVFLAANGTVKIGDFGLATPRVLSCDEEAACCEFPDVDASGSNNVVGGTWQYMAPELK